MGAIVSLLVITAVSLVLVRIGTTALILTGLSRDVASFQSHSAFFGVGFTTSEAELAVSTPQRRRIIKHLMLAGNLGITAGLGSAIVAFVKAEGLAGELKVLLSMAGGLGLMVLLASTPPMRQVIDWAIRRSLRRAGVLHAADYSLLLRVHAGFTVCEVRIADGAALVGKTLIDSRLGSKGVQVLGITRTDDSGEERFVGTPAGSEVLHADDLLTVYGTPERISELVR